MGFVPDGAYPPLIVLLMDGADRGAGLLRQKTQMGGRSNRTVLALVAVCSTLRGGASGRRANPGRATSPNLQSLSAEQQMLGLITLDYV